MMSEERQSDLTDAMLAGAAATAARTDQLCRIIETDQSSRRGFARAAWVLANEQLAEDEELLGGTQHLDEEQRDLHRRATESAESARRRWDTAREKWRPKNPDEDVDPLLTACARQIADAAQMEYHAGQTVALDSPRSRRAHVTMAMLLGNATAQETEAVRRSAEAIGTTGEFADAAHRATTAEARKNRALETIMKRRRMAMRTEVADDLHPTIERQLGQMADEFRNAESPILIRAIEIRHPITGEGSYEVAVVYEGDRSDVIRAKLARQAYPPDTEPDLAMQHAEYLFQYSQALENADEQRVSGTLVREIAVQASETAAMATCGLQCVDMDDIGALFQRVRTEMGVGPATARLMIQAMCAEEPRLAVSIVRALEAEQVATPEQAQTVLQSAEDSGLTPDTIELLAGQLGYEAAEMGFPRALPSREAGEAVVSLMSRRNAPAETTISMVEALGMTRGMATDMLTENEEAGNGDDRGETPRERPVPRLIIP